MPHIFIKKITRTITLLLILILAQGCLLTRLHQTQKQVCGKITRLEMTEEGLSVVFDKPLLTKKDIVSILGVKARGSASDGAALLYTALNKHDHEYKIPVTLEFRHQEKEYKLAKVSMRNRLQDVISEDLLHALFSAGCSAKRSGLGIVVDLSGVPMDKLPKSDDVNKLLGRPAVEKGAHATYIYEIDREDSVEITVTYGDEQDKPANIGITFQKYRVAFDFKKGVAIAGLKNFSDAVKLGFKP